MYPTKEIRWFFKKENEHLEKWFRHQNLEFETNPARKDIYLDVKKEDLNIKLREGHIEIKQRKSEPRARTQLHTICGYCEAWTKWSFGIKTSDDEIRRMTSSGSSEWIEVIKNRLAVYLISKNGNLEIRPLSAEVDLGCQVEYTKVQIEKLTWYTFGLEWFGDSTPELSHSFIEELIGSSQFTLKQSMGYAAFLKFFT